MPSIAIVALVCHVALASSGTQPTVQGAQDPAPADAAGSAQPQSGVRAGFWWADYDRDGLDDAFVVGADGAARLLRNSGDGSFADVTLICGLDGLGSARFAAWQDFDRDGAPDVFVGTQSGPGHLLRNADDGTFQDVTQFVGLTHSGRHLAAQWFDYDLDGLSDFAVRTDAGEHLYHALSNGHFEVVDLGGALPRPILELPADAVDIAADPDADVPLPSESDRVEGKRPAIRPPTGWTGVPAAPTRTPLAPPMPPGSYLVAACPPRIEDSGAPGTCLQASSVATLGKLYPLSIDLNVSGAGNVGIGTTTPSAKLDVVGSARISDTLTLNPSGDQALNVSTGSIYKAGALFIHTKGGVENTALGREALASVTSGFGNTANGESALRNNTVGAYNTASGVSALYSNTSGSSNTASGSYALRANTIGGYNTASGALALSSNTSGARNTANGYRALANNTTGARNTASGNLALYANTIGSGNTASGDMALYTNASGARNTASGERALYFNSTGNDNTASGSDALRSNTTGSRNTASGRLALRSNTVGVDNTASGYQALSANTTGNNNTAAGKDALLSNTTGSDNTAGGFYALRNNTAGNRNTASGRMALRSNTGGLDNTASGADALRNNTTGNNNTAGGSEALHSNTTGNENTAHGQAALWANTTGFSNTASGAEALSSNTIGAGNTAAGVRALSLNTSGTLNTASGYLAMRGNTSGFGGTATGYAALYSNTSGYFNTATGYRALRSNTTGNYNTADGAQGLSANTTGSRNTANGYQALTSNTTGLKNTASGSEALSQNTTGGGNTASGHRALYVNTSGVGNTASGYLALMLNAIGTYNTGIGTRALYAATGSRNTAMGRNAGQFLTTGSDNIAIGNSGVAAENSTIRIGTTGTQTRTFLAGIRGVTTVNANAIPVLIDSVGQLGTVSSSRRFKKDIVDMGDATENLLKLRPVRFRYKQEQTLPDGSEVPMEYGLIAEEVAEIFPDLVVYDDEGKPFTVKYHILSSMLLNELKKLREQGELENMEHARELDVLRARLDAVEARTSAAAGQRPTETDGR